MSITMNKFKFSIYAMIALPLFGCNGSDSEGIFGLGYQPKLIALDFNGLHKNNETATISSVCEFCDKEDINYTLWVDNNDDGEFTDDERLKKTLTLNHNVDYPATDKQGSYTVSSSTKFTITPDMLSHSLRVEASVIGSPSQSMVVAPPQGLKYVVVPSSDTPPSTSMIGAALTQKGTVVTWPTSDDHTEHGGYYDREDRDNVKYIQVADQLTDVKDVYATRYNATALLKDGTIKVWGEAIGGNRDYVQIPEKLTGVKEVFSNLGCCGTPGAWVALLEDGTIKTWGQKDSGGNGMGRDSNHRDINITDALTNVKTVYSSNMSFAALLEDGSVEPWGSNVMGGGSGQYQSCDNYSGDPIKITDDLTGVKKIYSNHFAFAALLDDGSIQPWGGAYSNSDGSDGCRLDHDNGRYIQVVESLTNVKEIYSNVAAFVALLEDDSVEVWGDFQTGGDGTIYDEDRGNYVQVAQNLTNVKTIFGSQKMYGGSYNRSGSLSGIFVALMKNGTVKGWGDGGIFTNEVADTLTGVKHVVMGGNGGLTPIALLDDGRVKLIRKTSSRSDTASKGSYFTAINNSGEEIQVVEHLHQVKKVVANTASFAALNLDGTIETWGLNYYDVNGELNFIEKYSRDDNGNEITGKIDFDPHIVKDIIPLGGQPSDDKTNYFAVTMKDGSIRLLAPSTSYRNYGDRFDQLNRYNTEVQGPYLVKESTL